MDRDKQKKRFQKMKRQEMKNYDIKVENGNPYIKQEYREIVNEAKDEHGNSPDHLACLFCLGIIYEPKRCLNSKCERFFCDACLK